MSDPVSNHDIEDVLSSIRRLVAQGNAESQQQKPHEPPVLRDVDAEPAPDRLILTPAFRVADDAVDSPQAPKLQSPPAFATEEDAALAPDMAEPAVFWTEEIPTLVAAKSDEPDRASLEATIAELEAAVTQDFDEWEPDGSEEAVESSVTSAFLHKLDARNAKSPEETVNQAVTDHIADTIAEEIAEAMVFEDATFAKVDPAQVAEQQVDLAEDDTVEEAAAEVVFPDPSEEPQFSHARFEEVYDPVAEATADAAEQEPGDVYGDELAPDDDPVFGPVGAPAGGQLVDPDALRALVGDMIREELQGEMGERITRNVRKLVRREINRVITEQEM